MHSRHVLLIKHLPTQNSYSGLQFMPVHKWTRATSSEFHKAQGEIHLLSRVWLFLTPWTAAYQASLSITNSWSLLKLISVMPSHHLILCHPLLLLTSTFLSIRVFSNEFSLCIKWPKYCCFSFSTSLHIKNPKISPEKY